MRVALNRCVGRALKLSRELLRFRRSIWQQNNSCSSNKGQHQTLKWVPMEEMAMKFFAALALAFAIAQGGFTPVQAQSPPVQAGKTPQQSEQSREQDRRRAEDVKIKRDWKAQGGEREHVGPAGTNKDHETVGRDWRAHPDNLDR
jgi:hypothetical protein